jgi:uncharacterized protein
MKELKMKKTLTILLSTTVLLMGSACLAKTPTSTPVAPAKIIAHPAMWVVKDSDTTIYLFGTMHAVKPNVTWFSKNVKRAYDASPEVVLELVEPEPKAMQAAIMQLGTDPKGLPLTKKLGTETAALYEKTMKDLGVPSAALEQFQPWFAAATLSQVAIQKAGYDLESGVEKTLFTAIKRDGKIAVGLETIEQQLGYFASLPQPLQIAFLKETIRVLPETSVMAEKMMTSWAKGDPDALAQQLNESMATMPELTKILLTDRNERWAAWIKDRMAKPGTVFVAVGGGHLAGKDSVQSFLKTLKIKAKRIPS